MSDALVMGSRKSRSVEQASNMLKKLYFLEREIMRTLGGYLVSVSSWELKKKIPLHFWQDSQRADALRSRVLEMRYPRRDVDQHHDEFHMALMSLPIRSNNDREFVEAVYFVLKKALCAAYDDYLAGTDPLDDAPTITFMKRFSPEIREQIADIETLYGDICSIFPEGSSWSEMIANYLKENGGVNGERQASSAAIPTNLLRPDYVAPLVPKTDPRFTAGGTYHLYPKDYDKIPFLERQIWMAINHVNEIWAAEVCATVMWAWDSMPWEFYTDVARWGYDELRHCVMGETRLSALGLQVGVDYPIIEDHYIAVSDRGPLGLLGALHWAETGSGDWKSGLMREFTNEGDDTSSQDFDYDWADESIHLLYGNKWLPSHFDKDYEKMGEFVEDMGKRWGDYYSREKPKWDYEPFFSRIQDKLAKLKVRGNDSV